MRFAASAAALLAFVSSALAQTADFNSVSRPAENENVAAGAAYQVTWTAAPKYAGKVTIDLLGGNDPSTLEVVSQVAAGVDNGAGTYTWSVPKTLGSAKTYGLKFTFDSDTSIFQYSQPFHITGGSVSTTSSSSSPVETSTKTSASSAATTKTSTSVSVTKDTSTTTPASSTVTVVSSTSYAGNSTATLTTTTRGGTGSASGTSQPSTLPTNAAGRVAAGSLALLGGVAAVAFAL